MSGNLGYQEPGSQGPPGPPGPRGYQGEPGAQGVPGVVNGLNFWRSLAIALLTFILGNTVSYVLFGLHAATRTDLVAATQAADQRSQLLEARMENVEKAVNYMGGQLSLRGIDSSPKP